MHPHPDQAHIMRTYRRHILASKKKWGTARGLVHYRRFVDDYLDAKRSVLDRGEKHGKT
jgi:hypothetical protein